MPPATALSLREQVIEAALRRLDAAGPDAVTLREVAADVGRSTQAIYSHFRDREDLMHALRVRVSVEMAGVTRTRTEALADPTLDALLEAAGLAILDYALAHPHAYQHAHTGVALTEFAGPPENVDVAEAWSFLLEPLRAARADASAETLDLELRLRLAITHGIATMAINGQYGPEPRAMAHTLLRAAMQLNPTAGWAHL